MNQTLMSPTHQTQQQPQQQQPQIDPQDAYGSIGMQTNQSSLSALESNTDQSSDLNLLDSYSNSATVNTSNMSSTAQKSSIDDSLLSQTTNDNSQSSQISDNANSMMQTTTTNSFNADTIQDENANQQSMDQEQQQQVSAYLESNEKVDSDFQKNIESNDEQQQSTEMSENEKIDSLDFGFGSELQKPKSADSTMINDSDKQSMTTNDMMTDVSSEISKSIENIPSQSKMESNILPATYPPTTTTTNQVPSYNMGYNVQQSPYNSMPHHQERTMLQQELYQLQPTPENQEKIHKLQERINVLQQHETTDQCVGGTPSCILQNPMFSMIDSPQVTSTTGRGRGRSNSSKPRKPRNKKSEKLSQAQSTEEGSINPSNLPVSEDSVTAGTGDLSQIYSEDHDMADISQDNSIGDLDTSTDASGKKIKKPRKPRIPKAPKSPKESKKKKEKDPLKKKSKKSSMSDENSISHDNNSTEFSKHTSEGEENQTLASLMHNQNSTDANSPGDISESKDISKLESDEVTDFDDIPVSKISVKSLLEGENKSGDEAGNSNEEDDSPNKKKKSDKRKSSSSKPRRKPTSGGGGSKSRRSGRVKIVQDSGDEDLAATPPASPTGEDAEIDSSKRRSARNTQRKKYTDDVMLRFSDDEGGIMVSPTKAKGDETKRAEGEEGTSHQSDNLADNIKTEKTIKPPLPVEDISNKPNYVYINTSDEDTMIVQYVLAQRMGKRELKPDPPPAPPVEIKKEETKEETPEGVETKVEEEIKTDENKDDSKIEIKIEAEESKTLEISEESNCEEKADEIVKEEEKIEEQVEKDPLIEHEDTTKMDVEESIEPEKADVMETSEIKEEESKSSDLPSEESPITDCHDESDESKQQAEDVKPEIKTETAEGEAPKEEKPEPVYVEVEEYLVKYRNFSYLHCEWRTEEELLKGDKRVGNKIRRFQQKQAQQFNIFENIEEDPFNPDFVEVDRILDVSEHTDDDGNKVKHYLVKWKSLAYEDSTWELEEDVDEEKIEQFERFNKLPPKSEWKPKKRPHPDQWKQLDKSPVYKNNNTLRPYQLEGLNWLKYSWYKGNNCILADGEL